ncbi:MAG: tetratricopeptide repeat protein [Bacteroidetes bacterium]|nr:tetratricopeptide repeat protein [Bacteroidota bacterium]
MGTTLSTNAVAKLWNQYSKQLSLAALFIIGSVAMWYAYQNFYQLPKEKKAVEALFRAEEYYRKDSIALALNGDGQSLGFIKFIEKHSGTKAADLACFYAGSCYLKIGDNAKAIRYLEKFSSDSKITQARAFKLLGDAYGDSGKNNEALRNYKKAGRHFKQDEVNSPEYLFMAAYFADQIMKNTAEAVALYEEIRSKYPRSQQSFDAEKNLARLGIYSSKD